MSRRRPSGNSSQAGPSLALTGGSVSRCCRPSGVRHRRGIPGPCDRAAGHAVGGERSRLGAVSQIVGHDGVIDRGRRQTPARAIAHQAIEAGAPAAVADAIPQHCPLGRQGHPARGHVVLLAEPAQRRRGIGFVVGHGLCRDAEASVVQLADRQADRGPPRRGHLERPVQPFGDLAQRTDPVTLDARGQVGGVLDRGHRYGEAGFEKGHRLSVIGIISFAMPMEGISHRCILEHIGKTSTV